LLLIGRLYAGQKFLSFSTFILTAIIRLLLVASHIQWTYYVNYQNKVFRGTQHFEQRSTAGNKSDVSSGNSKG